MPIENLITASIKFSFKGRTYSPECSINLDAHMQAESRVPDLHLLLANANNIGLYSYEYEILQGEPVHISAAQGLVADYVRDGLLDTGGFEQAWREQQVRLSITQIIKQHGFQSLLQQHPKLTDALFDIYRAGQIDSNTTDS